MMKQWQELFDNWPGRIYAQSSFSLKILHQGRVLRYQEGGRELTLLGEMADQPDEAGKTWRFFRTMTQLVYMQAQPVWDSGVMIDLVEMKHIRTNIEVALAQLHERCSFVIDDEVYLEAERDFAKFFSRSQGSTLIDP